MFKKFLYNILFLGLLISLSASAQDRKLSYPDYIPILVKDSVYGYADKDLSIKIDAQFTRAELFEEDFKFQILQVHNPQIVPYGTAEYAWVEKDGERYRINKKGELVYKFHAEDFKNSELSVQLFTAAKDYIVEQIEDSTLFQKIVDSRTGQQVFPDPEKMNAFKEKNKEIIAEGISFIFYPKFTTLPFEEYSSQETLLKGIRNSETKEILIKAKYASIEELYNNKLRIQQYPLIIAYRADIGKYIYVGLDGREYRLK